MPFYNNVYYPFQTDAQGTHSSAGIPSLLNSPQSQPSSGGQCRVSAMLGVPSVPVFKFRPRRESVDWRRISAIDVERVASELDFHMLQEHIMAITFCSVEHERCPHCQNPVDPVMLKLFRLAQLTVEYLLHSQDCLTLSLQAAEAKLQASAQEQEQLRRQLQKAGEVKKGLKEELKQRKKIIASQQSLISSGLENYHKCQHCDKAFMNYSFLQSHMQRRHPEDYDIKLLSENQKKVQSLKLQEEIEKLREQLTLARSQLESQQQAYFAKAQEQHQRSKEEDMLKTLERWKEEERDRQKAQMEEMREMFLKESKELSAKNVLLQSQLSEMEESGRKMRMNILALQEEKVQLSGTAEDSHRHDVQKLLQQLRKQEEKWASRIQVLQDAHEDEKNQLLNDVRRLHYSEEKNHRRMEELDRKLQEQKELIMSQREQLASNPPVKVVEHTVVASVPEPKLKSSMHDQATSVHKLDPIEELSEEDKDSTSVSEEKLEVVKQPPISALRKNPNIKRELRPILEQTLIEKLEVLGVKPGASRLSQGELKTVMAKVLAEREKRERQFPECQGLREDLCHTLNLRVKESETDGVHAQPRHLAEETQVRSRSGSLPSSVTQVVSMPVARQLQQHRAPQPAPRSKASALPKTSTPRGREVPLHRTPPFSSDEDSEEEEVVLAQKRPQGPKSRVISVTRPVVQRAAPDASDSEWTEGSDMEEVDPHQLQGRRSPYRQPAGQQEKTVKSHLVRDLTRDLERRLADRGVRKPPGGVSVLPENKNLVQELKGTKMDEDDDDDDDWDVSSLEDKAAVPKPVQSSAPVKKSLDSTNTSVWGSSTAKAHKGIHEADPSSTVKSSLATVSDWSDTDDI